ncbi:hypothetical protein [Tuanshanicoccus lijuaniae]|uniref:hypothetical protein n=1 Tax=Aerococcaceae bacterium zg-1292 TaxID=2774330 RepID=UPI001BD7FB24|nr:hypothetical protein [Aerococcaceae bacterium zg-BR9]MBS4456959.1 hypothetical protein [Aerococcaceae bacterium zg-A91]MBS4458820.1 hypothetical protein [Aerococcaceae bacterium zg-BR33]
MSEVDKLQQLEEETENNSEEKKTWTAVCVSTAKQCQISKWDDQTDRDVFTLICQKFKED